VGYEPSIAVDQLGTVYITAHKVLDRPETWPYLGSWFLVSRDDGRTWGPPAEPQGLPVPVAQQFLGDEGDIGVDARGWVYFVDTYLADNHLHVWSDQAQTWQSSEPVQKSTGLDDRPWVAAQGEGVVHYLGNNIVTGQAGGRVWYYRSTDAGLTWSPGTPIPTNGWAHLDAERAGQNVYITHETASGAADIEAIVSHDRGATFEAPVKIAHREGPGRGFPWVSAAPDGVAWAVWLDCGTQENCADQGGGQKPDELFLARTTDAGKGWQVWNVTFANATFADYPTVAAGPNGTLLVAFYGTTDVPVTTASQWHLYAAYARDALDGTPLLQFGQAVPEALYTGADLHALHDFFEIALDPEAAAHIAYMHGEDSSDAPVHDYGMRTLWYVHGHPEGAAAD
jgi:hypothetical protein